MPIEIVAKQAGPKGYSRKKKMMSENNLKRNNKKPTMPKEMGSVSKYYNKGGYVITGR